jgi:tetratricopeptide (TPR) repeat protein
VVCLLGLPVILLSLEPDAARQRFESADYEGAIELLAGADDPAALALLGRAHYGAGNFKPAIKALERATDGEPANAEYWDWLGRAYGRQAETGSMLRAFGWARKCRAAFERSVELDGDNPQALADLFEYYIGAPGVIGGSVEKAEAISVRLRDLDPLRHRSTQASLAKKRKDWPLAERHLRDAVELEPDTPDAMLSLARFLSDRERFDESDRLFAEAASKFPGAPKILYERAAAYIEAGRKPAEARRLLNRYLTADLTWEEPTPWEARRLLRRLN